MKKSSKASHQQQEQQQQQQGQQKQQLGDDAGLYSYRFVLPWSFLISLFLAVSALSFDFGHTCRLLLVARLADRLLLHTPLGHIDLPHVTYLSNESLPSTTYTARNFDTSFPATSSSVLARKDYETNTDASQSLSPPLGPEHHHYHYSLGQHVLIDIRNVDTAFLNHAGRLSQAMIDISRESKLQLLSVHCHALIPAGVTCVGVLLKSHITFHTWPDEGVILLDFMTFQRDEEIDNIVQGLEHFFGVPSADPLKKSMGPQSKWALKRRGFQDDVKAVEKTRFDRYVLGSMEYEYKKQVVATPTVHYKKVEIYDVIGYPRRLKNYELSLDATKDTYESRHAELYKPDRILLIDQVVQSQRLGEAAYNEALVHPAMLMIPAQPRSIAIIGGGTGAVLREVLKHALVESVVVVELDEQVVGLAREYLSEWSDCSNIVGGTDSCFDDPRVTIEYANGVDWFLSRRLEGAKYDAVILDVDPSSLFKFPNATARDFYKSIYKSISKDGVLVSSLGGADFYATAKQSFVDAQAIANYQQLIKEAGFSVTADGSEKSFNIVLASKVLTTSGDISLEDVAIRQRFLPTMTGNSPLRTVTLSGSRRELCNCEQVDGFLADSCHCQSPSDLHAKINQLKHFTTLQAEASPVDTPVRSVNPAPVATSQRQDGSMSDHVGASENTNTADRDVPVVLSHLS